MSSIGPGEILIQAYAGLPQPNIEESLQKVILEADSDRSYEENMPKIENFFEKLSGLLILSITMQMKILIKALQKLDGPLEVNRLSQ